MAKISTKRGALAICCVCFGTSVGLIVDSLSIFIPVICSELNLAVAQVSFMSTLLNGATALVSPLVTMLMARYPINRLMAGGVLLSAVSVMMMSFASNVAILYLLALLEGIGAAFFSTLPVVYLIGSWYGEENGTATGIAMACSGLAGAIASPVFSALILAFGWRATMRINCLLLMVSAFPATLMAAPGKYVSDGESRKSRHGKASRLVTPTFVALCVLSLLFTWTGALSSHLSIYGTDCGLSLNAVSYMLSASMISNVLSKTGAGWLSDRQDPFIATVVSCALSIVGLVVLIANPESQALLLLGSFLFGFSTATFTVLIALLVQQCIKADSDMAFSAVTVVVSLSFAGFISVEGLLRDALGSYSLIFVSAIITAVLAVVLVLVLRHAARERKTRGRVH